MNGRQALLLVVTGMVFASVIGVGLEEEPVGDDHAPRVVASIYPLGFLAREIGRGAFSVTVLMPPNQDAHAFHPTTRDWLEATRAELLVYSGAGADRWFEEELLPDLDPADRVVVETSADLDLLDADGDDDHDHGGTDPHTWLSPRMAIQEGQAIYEAMVTFLQGGREPMTSNWLALRGELEALDAAYTAAMANATREEAVVSHEAYGYLSRDYGFHQHGVIGISGDEQPSVAALADLVDLMREEGIDTVFVDPVFSQDYARTLEEELEDRTGSPVSVERLYFALGEVDGMDYLDQIGANLGALSRGLGVPP